MMKKVFGRIFVLLLPLVGVAWFGVFLFFGIMGGATGGLHPESMLAMKSMLNWILGITSLASIVLFPIGLVLLTKGSKTGEYISYGRKLAKKNIRQYWLPLVVLALIILGFSFAKSHYGVVYINGEERLNTTGIILTILENIIGVFYGIGLVKLGLQAGDEKKKFNLKTLFVHKWSEIWKSIVTPLVFGLLMAVLVGIILGLMFVAGAASMFNNMGAQNLVSISGLKSGFILLVIALIFVICYLIYVGMRVGMVLNYVIIDHNDLGIWGMIKYSRNMTKGKVWRIFIVGFLAGLTNILGALALGIGLLWTIPLTLIATAKIYQDIDKEYKTKEKIGE